MARCNRLPRRATEDSKTARVEKAVIRAASKRAMKASRSPKNPEANLQCMPSELVLEMVDKLLEEYPLGGYTRCEILIEHGKPSNDFMSFNGVKDAVHLGATCRKLQSIIGPYILQHDKKVNFSSALLLSVKKGSMDGVKRALINGHDINTPDWTLFEHSTEPYDDLGSSSYEEHYRTPVRSSLTSLHWACFYGNEELVSFLLEKGADFQQRAELGFRCDLDSDGSCEWWDSAPLGWTHSHRAMMTATKEQYLHVAFPPLCHLEIPIGANALFFALKGSSSPVHRAKWDALTFDQRDSLVTEDESGCRLAITERLIRAGSSLVTCEATKFHALHQAAAYRDVEVARFLMDELDVDPDVRNIYDETPLHVLARNRKHGPYKRTDEMVELLVERGADTNLKGSNGRTPGEMGLSIPAIL